MVRKPCPEQYVEHSDACYFFGKHSSYKDAVDSCKSAGARLVDIDPRNSKYVKDAVTERGENDNWIGSYIVRKKLIKRKQGDCPIMKGQISGRGKFSHANCNSANPFICQKYGNTQLLNQELSGFDPFVIEDLPAADVTTRSTGTTAVVAEESASNSGVIAAVVVVALFVVVIFVLRYLCKRRRRQAREDKIKEFQKSKEAGLSRVESAHPTMSLNTGFVNNIFEKQLSLPGNLASADYTDNNRGKKDTRGKNYKHDCYNYKESESSYSSEDETESKYHLRHSRRKRSDKKSVHEHNSPKGKVRNRDRSRSNKRRHSRSSVETTTESTTTCYTSSSRSSSSDGSTSRMTERSHRGREKRTRHLKHGKESSISSFSNDEDDRKSTSNRKRKKRSHRKPQSMYEQYAVARPPSPALDVMSRLNKGSDFKDRESYFRRSLTLRGGDKRYDTNLSHAQLPDSKSPTYFPQMTTVWSPEDFQFEELHATSKAQCAASMQSNKLQLRQGPVRVNRHIFEKPLDGNVDANGEMRKQIDVICETVQTLGKSTHQQEVQAIPLQRRTKQSIKT